MAGSIRKVNALFVNKVTTTGDYGAGDGLYLQVRNNGGRKSWLLRYMIHGRAHKMGLGSADVVSLAQAREKVRQLRPLLQEKIDPIEARRKKRSDERDAAARRITLAEARALWLKVKQAQWSVSSTRREVGLWKMYGPQLGPC